MHEHCPWLGQHITKTPASIVWNDTLEAWSVCNYQDVLAILKDERFSAASANATLPNNMPYRDLDPLGAQQEVKQSIRQQTDWIRQQLSETTEAFCLQLQSKKEFDLQKDLITPSCHQLALKLVGVPSHASESAALLELAQVVFLSNRSDSTAQQATIELSKFFLKIMPQLSANPKEDFVSTLLQTNQPQAVLLSPIIQLFVGLATSLPLLLGNTLLALLVNPLEKEKYLKNPTQALGELLRYAGPAQVVYRLALDKVQIGTHLFERGDRIALLLAEANFDETHFDAAKTLDVNRNSVAHLSLGKGVHSCLGAPIIRNAVELIPQIILKNFPILELRTKELHWGGSDNTKGMLFLPVLNKE